MKKIILFILALFFSFSFVLAEMEDFSEAESLIDSGIGCDELTENQLESIGDYVMEQMHPGEAHEIMDRMMGGEGSESLRQAHINMAYRFYCYNNIDDDSINSFGGGMMATYGYGMMGPGYGMMSGFGYGYGILSFVIQILFIVILVLVIIWLYKKITDKRR